MSSLRSGRGALALIIIAACLTLPALALDDDRQASALAERMIAAMRYPFVLNGDHLTLGISIVIAAHKDGDIDPEELLQRADQVMYRAKLAGGNAYR
jgi:GGDEF domain-containing protein